MIGNRKAERFWEKAGYSDVRRSIVEFGSTARSVRVMIKPLGGADIEQYFRQVPGDRPKS